MATRKLRTVWPTVVVAVAASCVFLGAAEGADVAASATELVISRDDRILVMAPHPDDEAIACGGIIQRAATLGVPVHVVFLTYGDNNEWSFAVYRKHPVLKPGAVRAMGEVRHGEAVEAGRQLGCSAEQLTFLGYPDFGTLDIWCSHWGDEPAFQSMLTRVTEVPYTNAFRCGAAYKGEEIVHDLKELLTDFKPTKILVSHPFDHNPDHRALWLFTTVALWDLKDRVQAEVLPYLVHWPKWPSPQGAYPTLSQTPPMVMPAKVQWYSFPLTPEAIDRKRAAIEAHKTQYDYAANYLLSFVRRDELFSRVPSLALFDSGGHAENLEPLGPREMHHELGVEERVHFVGIEKSEVLLHNGNLEFHFSFSRPLEEVTSFSLYAFGYRDDRPFGAMPKIHVKTGPAAHEILDQNAEARETGIVVKRGARDISITVPLIALRSPEKILTSARTYFGEIPLDWLGWRILEISGHAEEGDGQ